MKRKNGDLSARERVETALILHRMESPGTPISISAICRQASVSRANLYEHHRDLVEQIRRGKQGKPPCVTTPVDVSDLKQKLANEKKRAKALYYLCVELQAEIQRLEMRIALHANSDISASLRSGRGRSRS